MEKILLVIRSDLITMKGKGVGKIWIYAVLLIVIIAMGFFVSSFVGVYGPLFSSFIVPQLLFSNEAKYKSEKMYCIAPVERRDIVNARFLLTTAIIAVLTIATYLLMLIAIKLDIPSKYSDNVDVLDGLIKQLHLSLTKKQLFDLLYSVVSVINISMGANMLRNYFKDPALLSGKITTGKKLAKRDVIGLTVTVIMALFVLAGVVGLLPFGKAFVVLFQVIAQLAEAANGKLLILLMLFLTGFETAYQYFCARVEYADKEL